MEQYQDFKELVLEPWTDWDTRFPNHVMYPPKKELVIVPSIVLEHSEENFSTDRPILMERIFNKDLVIARLREEGLNNLYENMDRQSYGIMVPYGPRNVSRLSMFVSMEVKMPIASLLKGNPTLWHGRVHQSRGNQVSREYKLTPTIAMESSCLQEVGWCEQDQGRCINLLMHRGIRLGKSIINIGDVHA